MDLFYQDEGMGNVINLDPDPAELGKQEQSYDEVVKEFIIDEKKYLRDLHMITKVFRDRLGKNPNPNTFRSWVENFKFARFNWLSCLAFLRLLLCVKKDKSSQITPIEK